LLPAAWGGAEAGQAVLASSTLRAAEPKSYATTLVLYALDPIKKLPYRGANAHLWGHIAPVGLLFPSGGSRN